MEALLQRYYFELRLNDETRPDDEGTDLADEASARREAVRTIASIAAEEIPHDGPLKLVITVSDDRRIQVFRTRVTFEFEDVETA